MGRGGMGWYVDACLKAGRGVQRGKREHVHCGVHHRWRNVFGIGRCQTLPVLGHQLATGDACIHNFQKRGRVARALRLECTGLLWSVVCGILHPATLNTQQLLANVLSPGAAPHAYLFTRLAA